MNNFVEERRRQREEARKKMKIYLVSTTVVLLVVLYLALSALFKGSIDYSIRYSEEKVSRVNFVDDLTQVDQIVNNNSGRYHVQTDLNKVAGSIEKLSKKLRAAGVENYYVKEGKVFKLTMLEGFASVEEAESYAEELKSKKLIDTYTVRVR